MRRARFGIAAVLCGAVLAALTASALGESLVGTGANELLAGTHAGDRLKGKAGDDVLKGRAGDDLLVGGQGRDTLIGGPGADRIIGGPGDDVVKATDGRTDRLINGGGGANVCVIDIPVDLASTVNCDTVQAGALPGVGGGGGGGGGGAQGETSSSLQVTSAQGLTCLAPLGCVFTITGKGADALIGSVTAGGAVTSLANVAVNGVVTGTWLATGTYSCSEGGSGWLVVTIGSKSTPRITVNC
jgi:Ca2+-binding RTX toxin-like protein